MKVIGYNIHRGKNIWYRDRFKQMLQFLKEENADFLGVQEIQDDQAEEIAMHFKNE